MNCFWFFGFLIAQRATGIEFVATYSAFSGLTMQALLGSRQQKLSLALDFGSGRTWLYSMSACPPSVESCFDISQSMVVRMDSAESDLIMDGAFTGRSLGATFRLAGTLMGWLRFTLITNAIVASPRYREVAGALAVGREGGIFQNRLIALSECEDGIRINEISRRNVQHNGIVVQSSPGVKHWSFTADIVVGTLFFLSESVVRFDPSEQDLVFPSHQRFGLIELLNDNGFDVRSENRMNPLVSPCPGAYISDLISLQLTTSTGSAVLAVPTELLLFRGEAPECRFRIRFSESANEIVIGRQLITIANRVILDYRDGSIRFETPDKQTQLFERYPIAIPRIPVYETPKISARLDRSTTISFPVHFSGIRSGLVLVSRRPSVSELEGTRQACWRFVRIHPSSSSANSQVSIPGEFVDMIFRIDNRQIMFDFRKFRAVSNDAASVREFRNVSVRDSSHSVEVCRKSRCRIV